MKKVLALPARYLDITPMYTVVIHALVGIYMTALLCAAFGLIGFTLLELLATGAVVLLTSFGVSYLCAVVTKVPAQHASSVITGLILTLLILPSAVPFDLYGAAVMTALAIASKYVIVYKRQHFLNPVAVGLVLGVLLGFGGGAWWVASPWLFVPLLIGGLLVAEKVKRLDMVAVFLSVALLWHIGLSWNSSMPMGELLTTFWFSFPFVFLAFFMLTEPFTMPSQKNPRLVYAVVVATLASLPPQGGFVLTPELALVVGNLLLAPWSLRQKLVLSFIARREITPRIYEFTFTKPMSFRYQAGQYLEWMLPHQGTDNRGVRRYFTILSAPHEENLRVAFKVPEKASTFKEQMMALQPGEIVIGSQLAGDFLLPADTAIKLGFIAGGIGVTPFVSHALTIKNGENKRDIATLYCVSTVADLSYCDELAEVGTVVPVIGAGEIPPDGESGFLSADIIKQRVPDYAIRTWYISGPPKMVDSTYGILRGLRVPARHIKRDFFPGLS
jgi:glycine betaine catabolism B